MKNNKTDLAYKKILQLIRRKNYDKFNRLPPVQEIANSIPCSTTPVHLALKILESEGILSRPKGTKKGARYYYEGDKNSKLKPVAFLFQEGASDENQVSQAIWEYLSKQGISFHSFKFPINSNLADILDYKKYSGIILYYVTLIPPEKLNFINEAKIPIVCIKGDPNYPFFGFHSDNLAGINMLITYLYQLGHRQIGYLDFQSDKFHDTTLRNGFKSTMDKFGLEGKVLSVPRKGEKIESVVQNLSKKLSNSKNFISALICNSIQLMPILLLYFERNGIIVPGDLSLASFGNSKNVEFYLKPFGINSITSIVPNYTKISEEACQALLEQIFREINTTPKQVFIEPLLIKGYSSITCI